MASKAFGSKAQVEGMYKAWAEAAGTTTEQMRAQYPYGSPSQVQPEEYMDYPVSGMPALQPSQPGATIPDPGEIPWQGVAGYTGVPPQIMQAGFPSWIPDWMVEVYGQQLPPQYLQQPPVQPLPPVQPAPQIMEAGLPLLAGAAAAVPAIAGIGVKAVGWLAGKGLLQTLVKAGLAGGVASAAWGMIQNIFGLTPEQAVVEAMKKKRRRYSIGSNPRVRTLQKVSRHCQRLLKRHEKVIREFLPKRTRTYGIAPSKVLSAVERKAIAAGG